MITQAECVAMLIEEFSRCEFTKFCVAPGSRNSPVILAGIEHADVSFRVFHDERSMAFFALGMARRGKTVPVLLTTSGTAVANLLPAVIEAEADAVSMIVISADRPESQRGKGANQTITQTDIFGANTPTFTIDEHLTGYALLDVIAELRERMQDKPGPIHINLPLKKPLLEVANLDLMSMNPLVSKWYQSGKPWKALSANKMSVPARSDINSFDTLIVGANPRDLSPNIERFLRDFEGETFFDIQSGSWTCGSRPLSAEVFGGAKAGARLLIIGHRFTEHRIWQWISKFDYVEQWKAPRGVFDPNGGVHKSIDIKWFHRENDRSDGYNNEHEIIEGPLSYSKLVSVISSQLMQFNNVHLANSLTVRAFDRFREKGDFSRSSSLTFNRGASGIDGTLATGLGVAYDGDPSLIVCGDHAFLYDLSILPDLHESGITATVVIVDNKGGRIFEHLPISKNRAIDEYFVAPPKAKLSGIIRAFGFECEEVNTTTELNSALTRSYRGVRFIIANVDPAFDLKDFNDCTEERFS